MQAWSPAAANLLADKRLARHDDSELGRLERSYGPKLLPVSRLTRKMNEHLNLANRLNEVVVGNLTCTETWGFYLFDPAFQSEPELRNKIGTIWLCSLLDTLEADIRFIPAISEEAAKKGYESLVVNCAQLQKFCTLVGELMDQYSREEQIFLVDLRSQWVHGYFANRHRPLVQVKFAASGVIVSQKLPWEVYSEVIRMVGGDRPLDKTLSPLIARALNRKLRYWVAVEGLQRHREELYRIIREGEVFQITI